MTLRPSEGERPAVLVDALLARTITLDAELELVTLALDGRRTVDELLGDLASVGLAPETAAKNLRAIILLNVLEGVDPAAVPALRKLHRGEADLEAAVLPETRHVCQGSGGCCHNYRVGPLTDADVARIDAVVAQGKLPDVDAEHWYATASLQGRPVRFLRTRDDGTCVFLNAERRCGLHAVAGPAAKPRACARYPLDLVLRYDGVHVVDRGGCDSYAVAIQKGLPVIRDAPRLAPFMEESPRLSHPLLVVPGGALVDWAFVHPVVDLTIRDVARNQGSAAECLRALGRRLTVLGRELAEAPALDLPARALAMACDASSGDPWAPTAPQSITVGARATVGLFVDLVAAAEALRLDEKAPFFARQQASDALPTLRVVAETASRLASPGARISPEAARALGVSVDDPAVDAAMRYHLRQELFGHGMSFGARVQTCLLRLASVQLAALYGARLAASARGGSPARAEDFGPSHAVAVRLLGLDAFLDVMTRHVAQARAVLEALPTLSRWR